MKEQTKQVRIYKSDSKDLLKQAKKEDTTIARVIHEALEDAWKYRDLSE